jgi:hypothetical protein
MSVIWKECAKCALSEGIADGMLKRGKGWADVEFMHNDEKKNNYYDVVSFQPVYAEGTEGNFHAKRHIFE